MVAGKEAERAVVWVHRDGQSRIRGKGKLQGEGPDLSTWVFWVGGASETNFQGTWGWQNGGVTAWGNRVGVTEKLTDREEGTGPTQGLEE